MTGYRLVFLAVLGAVVFAGQALGQQKVEPASNPATKLVAPGKGENIPVAFVLTEGSVMIDFAGPWEVFQDVHVPSRGPSMDEQMPFELYTVSDSKNPVRTSDGMQVVPDYTFDDAPRPKIVVVPAQSGRSPKMLEWVRKMSTQSDVLMSVCTGAFVLGEAGVLNGKKATTHHSSYSSFEQRFPDVMLQRNMRYVQSDAVIFTAGGLSSGIDLALHIVELYFGRDTAEATAAYMEYEGRGWKGDGSSSKKYSVGTASSHPSDGASGGVVGNWQGRLATDHGPLQVVIHVWQSKDGSLTGMLDSPDQAATDIPITTISLKQPNLHFEVASIGGTYDGKLNLQGSAISGTWTQHGISLPLTFQRVQQ